MKRWLTATYPIPRWFILATLVLALTSLVVIAILAVAIYELEDKVNTEPMMEYKRLYGLDAPLWYKMLKRTDAKIGFAADAIIIVGCLWILSWKNRPDQQDRND